LVPAASGLYGTEPIILSDNAKITELSSFYETNGANNLMKAAGAIACSLIAMTLY